MPQSSGCVRRRPSACSPSGTAPKKQPLRGAQESSQRQHLSAVETVGSAAARDLAGPDDVAALSYTAGATGKSKGALRRHRELPGFAGAVLANFEIPTNPQFLAVAPISHVAGTKVLPT